MVTLLEILFWAATLALLFTYVIYPAITFLMGLSPGRLPAHPTHLPKVTLVISACNDEAVIGEKIENALALEYPRELVEIVVISDASTDRTDEIVTRYAAHNVRLFRQKPRGGKSKGLTSFVPKATGEVVVFSSAASMCDRLAITRLVRHFEDPKVGYVVGDHRHRAAQAEQLSVAEHLYWSMQVGMKRGETRLGSVIGADGALFGIRAGLFQHLRDDDLHDFVLPLSIISQGYRGVFDQEAWCTEEDAYSVADEFPRKVHSVNRAFRAVCRAPSLLNPLAVGPFAFQLLCRKVLRWFAPYFLILILLTSIVLTAMGAGGLYFTLLGIQVICYSLAALHLVPGFETVKIVVIPYYFCIINFASLLGTTSALRGQRLQAWQLELE